MAQYAVLISRTRTVASGPIASAHPAVSSQPACPREMAAARVFIAVT